MVHYDDDNHKTPQSAALSPYILVAILALLIAVPLAIAMHGEDNRGLFDDCDDWLCETLR